MTSKSSLYRKRRRYLEEVEREHQEEFDALEASGSVSVPASAGMSCDEANDPNSSSLENIGGGIGNESSMDYDTNYTNDMHVNDINTNDINTNDRVIDDIDEPVENADDFWRDAYSFLNSVENLKDALKYLAIVGHLSRSFLNLLLAILRKFGHPELPKDARTLLKIPKVSNEIQSITRGRLWYPGIEVALRNLFKDTIPEANQFSLQISIDGLPLFRSSPTEFWPILFKINEIPDCPVMVAGIYSGQNKPKNLEQFLRPLVAELNVLHSPGMQFGHKTVPICVKAFVTDSPARALIKSVLGFQGKHGCTKCTVVGERVDSLRKNAPQICITVPNFLWSHSYDE
ncbi:uncharacterized protein LOC128307498 [Anopheles moucheti]|uniref:uncharacterized protein LOC128307498 n=1 Tax=Anopheles moucheti TaxID=186751 RepID=UPI0022F04A88|nr:uncharacterized protein LOC128307498 [Anopheles moucheti]